MKQPYSVSQPAVVLNAEKVKFRCLEFIDEHGLRNNTWASRVLKMESKANTMTAHLNISEDICLKLNELRSRLTMSPNLNEETQPSLLIWFKHKALWSFYTLSSLYVFARLVSKVFIKSRLEILSFSDLIRHCLKTLKSGKWIETIQGSWSRRMIFA